MSHVAQQAVTAIREMAKDKKTAIGQREFIALETRIKTFRILFDRLKAEGDSELLDLFAVMDRLQLSGGAAGEDDLWTNSWYFSSVMVSFDSIAE